MSKSKGNVVAPANVAKTYGVEILRLWVALSDYSSDLKISENILKQVSEQYRKIRNTIRFLLANVNDLEDIETSNFNILDRWILSRAKKTFDETEAAFRNYDFSKGFSLLMNFLSADLSGIYLDICKDRLYCDARDSDARRSAQSAMALITRALLPLIAPTLTYTADEAMDYAPGIIKNGAADAFDLEYAPLDFEFNVDDELLVASREKFFELIDVLKKDKKIKSTLELVLQTSSNLILSEDINEISDWYMVSDVQSLDGSDSLAEFDVGNDKFKLVLSMRHKCPRCWKFAAKHDGETCPRCEKVLKNV